MPNLGVALRFLEYNPQAWLFPSRYTDKGHDPCTKWKHSETGTTNDQMDAWFIGYTPEWVLGVWVGYDVKRSLGRMETGGKAAAPAVLYFLQEFLKDAPEVDFNTPEPGQIDDGVMLGILARVRGFGFDSFLLPQRADLPMANRREDILILKP